MGAPECGSGWAVSPLFLLRAMHMCSQLLALSEACPGVSAGEFLKWCRRTNCFGQATTKLLLEHKTQSHTDLGFGPHSPKLSKHPSSLKRRYECAAQMCAVPTVLQPRPVPVSSFPLLCLAVSSVDLSPPRCLCDSCVHTSSFQILP